MAAIMPTEIPALAPVLKSLDVIDGSAIALLAGVIAALLGETVIIALAVTVGVGAERVLDAVVELVVARRQISGGVLVSFCSVKYELPLPELLLL